MLTFKRIFQSFFDVGKFLKNQELNIQCKNWIYNVYFYDTFLYYFFVSFFYFICFYEDCNYVITMCALQKVKRIIKLWLIEDDMLVCIYSSE